MRRLLSLSLLFVGLAAGAQVPAGSPPAGPPPGLRIPGLSPAGVAALDKLKNQQDPAVPKQIAAEAAMRRQMAALLSAPTVDPDKLAASLAQARAVQANGRKIMDDHLLIMGRALPPGDRPVLLRAMANPRSELPAK